MEHLHGISKVSKGVKSKGLRVNEADQDSHQNGCGLSVCIYVGTTVIYICFFQIHICVNLPIYLDLDMIQCMFVHLGDNCIQHFHLGRYIVGYTVRN